MKRNRKGNKRILFFSRCELTYLYGSLSEKLKDKFEIIHLAYSHKEAKILAEEFKINDCIIFKNEISQILETANYSISPLELDSVLSAGTDGRFSLNSAIQSDRGFSELTYKEAIKLSQVYYTFWNTLLSENNIGILMHEIPSLFFNHIAAVLCKLNEVLYCSHIMVKTNKRYSFIFIGGDDAHAFELSEAFHNVTPLELENTLEELKSYLDGFRSDISIYLKEIIPTQTPYFKILLSSIKNELKKYYFKNKINKINDNIDFWQLNNNRAWERFKNLVTYSMKLKYDVVNETEHFYYYPMHLEPEAVVLYWGDGLYRGQVKLIQNIAAQLPPNTYLYVKDHPHYIGYRNFVDYQEIKKIPNIKLIKPEYPGKLLVKQSKGVITINGTGGLEGILMNKPVFIFGNSFYDYFQDRVIKIANIKELKGEILKSNFEEFCDDENMYRFVYSYLQKSHEGVTDYFAGRINKYPINPNENIDNIAGALQRVYERIFK